MTATARELREAETTRSPFSLKRLIAPVDPAAFLTGYLGREPLVVRREDAGYYADLLTLADVDHILGSSSLRPDDVRVVKDGKVVTLAPPLQNGMGNTANALEAAYAKYRDGATINLIFLHERWLPLKRLCQELAESLDGNVQTNIYLTPAGKAQALNPHYDIHDVFVLQIHGDKTWWLYDSPSKLPLRSQGYSASQDGPGEPIQEFTLTPGDLLYLPRGQMHAATSQDTASCHVTVGYRPVLWASIVRDAVEDIVSEHVGFREGVPPGFTGQEDVRRDAEALARDLIEVVRHGLSSSDLVERAATQARMGRQPALEGHLLDLEKLPGITPDTRLRRRPGLLWDLVRRDGRVVVEFHGKRVGFPRSVEEQVRFVTRGEAFACDEIPGPLDETGRLVLVRKLVTEGFLTIC
jgi:hypothetical protein